MAYTTLLYNPRLNQLRQRAALTTSLTHMHIQQTLPTWNQSMVQQLTSEGNCLNLFLKASPMGLKAITMWKRSRHRCTKNANSCRGLMSAFFLPPVARLRTNCGEETGLVIRYLFGLIYTVTTALC